MSYGRRRGLRPVSPYVIVLALAVALTASFFLPARAEAAISDHTVTTISPSGTTINLFDYWVNPDDHLSVSGNGGINAGHKFQFKDQGASEDLNKYTGGSQVRTGIVNNVLAGGYPRLTDRWEGESLGYLFDSSVHTGKISHMGVTGLLQAKGGYYEYDSSQNYAAYNANKNAFDVYNAAGVKRAGSGPQTVGQFFPFDAADEVFKEEGGKLVPNGITSQNVADPQYNGNKPLNHYFGLSMSTRFVQPAGGKTNAGDDMVFEFAGDDDVWVFIDDVLVGDIGGIHNRASLSINFCTGDIKVNGNNDGALKNKYQKANKDTSGFNGNTFADGTNHTLKFFYLERGATDSNMELKFNLVTVPESDIIKFDQDGKFVQGAEFKLYKTDKDFKTVGELIGSGTTDEAGHLTLTNDVDNGVINFDDLYNKDHDNNKYYLLKETRVPEGYRSSLAATGGSMQLEYVPASAENGAGGVIINRGGMDAGSVVWKTGAFAAAKETITAPSTVYKANNDLTKSDKTVNLDSGILFAVVLKRDKSAGTGIKDPSNWYAVSGDPSTGAGYTLAKESGMTGAIEAAKKDLHAFTLNTSGQYQVEIQNLPGDISKYYYLLSGDARKDAEYTVAIYHTTASSIGDATPKNTVHVYSDDIAGGTNFKRQFATRLLVTNIQNRLFVQKTDTEGKPVDGAKFGLYKSTQVTTDANGKAVLDGDQAPYDTLTTRSVANPVKLEGAGVFPSTSDSSEPLVKGTYFLKEVSAPNGFLLNDRLIKVIVDDYGVHADAGTVDDGVSTFVGVGSLMKSLGQFGAEGDIDNTLTWIKGQRQTSDGTLDGNGNLSWNNDAKGGENEVHLKYGANGRVYQYGPTKKDEPYRLETETGWIRMGITQDVSGDTNAKGARADLGDMNLNALFTGATCVRVANEREASLEVMKKVMVPAGLTGKPDAGFTFKFTVPTTAGKTYKAAVFENAGTASEKQVGKMFDLENGREQTITADQTIRVYGLAEGDQYAVQELTGADKMPAGYKLTGRKQGDKNLTEEGDSISGRIAPQNSDGTVAKDNKLVFTNSYTAKGSVELTATKVVAVAPGFTHDTKLKGGEYTFELKDADGKVLDTAKNDANGKVCFTREFQLSDLDGAASKDFTYTIVEQPGAEPGMVYDNHALTYTVTVTDGGNGALNAKAIVTSASGSDTFTNTYQPAATGLALGAQKSYVKKDDNTPIVPKDGEFTFDVYEGKMTAEQLAGAKPVRTATNGADGSVNFDAFSYAKPGTYEYTIVERKGDLAYVTYDDAVHHAVVTVVDNAGTLQASVAYDGADATKPTFTNTYKAKATNSGAIALTKSVDVHDGSYQLKAGDFAFELVGSDGTVLQTQKNDAKGKVYFNELTFDHAGTFPFTVREVQPTDGAPGVPGVTYTGKTYTLTYVVKDNNDGKLVVESSTVKPSEGTENGVTPNTMTFANSYQPGQTSYQISGTKVLENADPATTRTPADGEFTFALIDVATGQEIDRTTNVGKAFTFKAISYTATGSHAYQVKEVAGQDGTITYSDAVLDVTVNVTDDGSGQLTATANKTAADLTFTNTYTPTATTATITGTKALTGRDLAEGEFFFDLKDADGNVVQTVQNGADGTFGFAPLQLDKVGTYVYTVSERAGATANGVTYDTTVFTATVTVTENAETHALEAQVAYSKGGKAADAVAFSNSYAPAATEVKLGASKVLSGEDLKEGQFSFQLKDADGKVLQTAKNAADGTVGFEAISYDKPGTYAYSISEVDDGQKNVTYDAAEHRVTVTVTDDGAGHLVATVTYDGAVAPVFKNTYTPPTTPPTEPPTNPPSKSPVPKEEKPGLPYTGDTSLSPMALGGIAGGAVVLIAAGVILRRRNR